MAFVRRAHLQTLAVSSVPNHSFTFLARGALFAVGNAQLSQGTLTNNTETIGEQLVPDLMILCGLPVLTTAIKVMYFFGRAFFLVVRAVPTPARLAGRADRLMRHTGDARADWLPTGWTARCTFHSSLCVRALFALNARACVRFARTLTATTTKCRCAPSAGGIPTLHPYHWHRGHQLRCNGHHRCRHATCTPLRALFPPFPALYPFSPHPPHPLPPSPKTPSHLPPLPPLPPLPLPPFDPARAR